MTRTRVLINLTTAGVMLVAAIVSGFLTSVGLVDGVITNPWLHILCLALLCAYVVSDVTTRVMAWWEKKQGWWFPKN